MSKELKDELVKNDEPKALAKVDPVKELLFSKMESALTNALPKTVDQRQFAQTVYTAIKTNPKLAQCSTASLAGAVMTMAQYNLSPLHGQAFLIPRWSKKAGGNECSFQFGYKGLLQLARRSGEIRSIGVDVRHENDGFEMDLDHEGGRYKLSPCLDGDRGKALLYIARASFINGGHQFEWMSRAEVEKHRDRFCASKNREGKIFGPWKDDFDAMASKTVLLKLLRYLPLSTEDITLLNRDDKVSSVEEDNDFDLSEIVVEAETYEEAGE